MCERELDSLDMAINWKKSCCMRIGPRHDAICASICSFRGTALPWVQQIRYLGIFIVQSRTFKCSLDSAKKSFYRSANAIFGEVGRVASEEVVLQLIISKCVPCLLYGLEACSVVKSQLHSLDFVVNRLCMKLFKTSDINVVKDCQSNFGLILPSVLWQRRVTKLDDKVQSLENPFVNMLLSL